MFGFAKRFAFIIVLLLVLNENFCNALNCQNDDGPSEEDVKKVYKVCMKKAGDKTEINRFNKDDGNNNRDSSSDSDSNYDNSDEESDEGEHYYNSHNNNNNNNNNNDRFPRTRYRRAAPNKFEANNYNKNQQKEWNYMDNFNNNDNKDLGNRHNKSTTNKSCFSNCFFQEFKMTNTDGFPDKHKTLQVFTKDIRTRELKEFYQDSIQECFHFVDMQHNKDKCSFTNSIVTCLTERAKANCDDFQNLFK